jgi:hypothetical protein
MFLVPGPSRRGRFDAEPLVDVVIVALAAQWPRPRMTSGFWMLAQRELAGLAIVDRPGHTSLALRETFEA